jgi:hypothetical protein
MCSLFGAVTHRKHTLVRVLLFASEMQMKSIGMKAERIISASDPIRIRIMRIWRKVFDIHADVDNLNPIVCGCGLGYGVSDIRRIWIIR